MITAETYRERIARDTRPELEAQIALMQEVVDENLPGNEHVAFYRDVAIPIAQERLGYAVSLPEYREDDVKVYDSLGRARQQSGQGGANLISEKQLNFLRKLIAEKDTTGIEIPENIDRIGKVRCSALIDRLIDRPAKPGTSNVRLASEKQVNLILKLAGEKQLNNFAQPELLKDRAYVEKLPVKDASQLIDALLAAPRKQVERKVEKSWDAGAYITADGRIIRVYLGQQSGKMLSTELVDATATDRNDAWHYLGLASKNVPSDARLMTPEEAEAASAGSADHGWCCVCGRELDVPESVARGIGPVCRAKLGG